MFVLSIMTTSLIINISSQSVKKRTFNTFDLHQNKILDPRLFCNSSFTHFVQTSTLGVHLSADYYRVYKMCTRNIEGWKNVNKITLNFGLDYLQSSRHKI